MLQISLNEEENTELHKESDSESSSVEKNDKEIYDEAAKNVEEEAKNVEEEADEARKL